jgi:hypothetical protein
VHKSMAHSYDGVPRDIAIVILCGDAHLARCLTYDFDGFDNGEQ